MRTLLICWLALTHAACSPARCNDKTVFLSYTLANGAEAANTFDVTVAIGTDAAKTTTVARKTSRASGSIEVSFGSYPSGKSLALTLTARADAVVLATASQTTTAMPGCTLLSLGLDGSIRNLDSASADAAAADAAELNSVDLAEPAPDLTKLLGRGESCSPSGRAPCAAGLFCVDGVCCDSACTGQCQACNLVGAVGTCATVTSGLPLGNRAPCSGTGTCGGNCTGASATQCTYPSSSTVCGAACDGTCDGAGTCSSSGGGSCPNGFGCMASGCRTSCSTAGDCQPNHTCNAPNCVRIPESDCLDGIDNNGDGKADCEDPTCTEVACVPAVVTGNELGLFQTDDCPANDFTLASAQHQTLNSSCDGCTCSVKTSCTMTLNMYNMQTTNCASAGLVGSVSITGTTAAGPGPCATFSSTFYDNSSIRTNTFTASGTCESGGSASASASWGTTKSFCGAARQSSTCGSASQVCVRKPPATTPMCVRVPSAAGCPAGYPNAQGTWYSGYNPAECSCGCTKNSDGTCPTAQLISGVRFYSMAQCSSDAGGFQTSEATSTCLVRGVYRDWSIALASARFTGPITLDAPGTCTANNNTDVAAMPTGPSTICCQ